MENKNGDSLSLFFAPMYVKFGDIIYPEEGSEQAVFQSLFAFFFFKVKG